MNFLTDRNRIHCLNQSSVSGTGRIIYWMSREHRIDDNWALLHALELADGGRQVEVVAAVSPPVAESSRSFSFRMGGLVEVEQRAAELGIGFRLLSGGSAAELVGRYVQTVGASALVCDFNPLRESLRSHSELAGQLSIPVIEVDSRNIVPCRWISGKQEYSAYTLRTKIERVLPAFLTVFPPPEDLSGLYVPSEKTAPVDWPEVDSGGLRINPGYSEGMRRLESFIDTGLAEYDQKRNDPTLDAQSGLSPWLHLGQISAQTAALRVASVLGGLPLKGGFLDELIVRRELSDNFCLYNPDYDRFEGFPGWARHSLSVHAADRREFLYGLDELERAETHEPLWNAAQNQMLETGLMHGYMRMYWAKKILEWSPDPAAAMRRAVFLNDKYSLDGTDPNGYAGCAWAVGGVHDRAWSERPVFGKIRYMNENGCRRKFDVDAYISRFGG